MTNSNDPTYYWCMKCGFIHYSEEDCMLTKKQVEKIEKRLDKKLK